MYAITSQFQMRYPHLKHEMNDVIGIIALI